MTLSIQFFYQPKIINSYEKIKQWTKAVVTRNSVFYKNKIYGNKKCYNHSKWFRPTRLGNIYVLKKRKRDDENENIFSEERRHISNSLTSTFLRFCSCTSNYIFSENKKRQHQSPLISLKNI